MASELDSLKNVYKKAKDFLKFMDDSYSNTHTDGDKEEEIRSNLVLAIRNYEKRKNKVKVYRPITKEGNNYILYDRYCNNKDLFHGNIVGWQEMEVEVDE